MANRSYLYSLSNQPSAYADRPETISGLSEWGYNIPFSYRLLMSGNPQLCSSLLADDLEDADADADDYDDDDNEAPESNKVKLYAISGDFEQGFTRLKKFLSILKVLVANKAPNLITESNNTIEFLEAHRDRYLLLETIELDLMSEDEEAKLRARVEQELANCQHVGAAVDALPDDITEACKILQAATQQDSVFYGLQFNDDFDTVDSPLGISEWSDILYFSILNRAKFEANKNK